MPIFQLSYEFHDPFYYLSFQTHKGQEKKVLRHTKIIMRHKKTIRKRSFVMDETRVEEIDRLGQYFQKNQTN